MPRGRPDADVLKALSHPLRREIMNRLAEGVASTKELAEQLGHPPGTVGYHVNLLRDLGLIKLARETQRRGAVERHYETAAKNMTVREAMDSLLSADQSKPKGWRSHVIELDDQARDAIDTAVERFWKDVHKAEKAAADRGHTRPDTLQRYAFTLVRTRVRR